MTTSEKSKSDDVHVDKRLVLLVHLFLTFDTQNLHKTLLLKAIHLSLKQIQLWPPTIFTLVNCKES